MKLPKPRCGVCGVDVTYFLAATRLQTGDFSLVARCHGEREEVILTRAEMVTLKEITIGVAFAPKPAEST